MGRRPLVSIGDFVRAARTLALDDDSQLTIVAEMLGLRSAPQAKDPSVDGNRLTAPIAQPATLAAPASAGGARPATSPGIREADVIADDFIAAAAVVEALGQEAAIRRTPRETPPLDTLLGSPNPPDELPETSLFVPRWQRGIVTTLVSTERPVGTIDVHKIVRDLAAGNAIRRFPRANMYTTRSGLQLLLDIGEGMRPFADDAALLERLLRQTVGEALVVMRFDRTLADGAGRGTRRTWTAYEPPAAAAPILVLSDFGLAGGADHVNSRAVWQSLADAAAIARCPLLALTPFPGERWPSWLNELFATLQWDRPTNAAMARRVAVMAARKHR